MIGFTGQYQESSSLINQTHHQSFTTKPWTKYRLSPLDSPLQEITKCKSKKCHRIYPKPLLYDKRLGFTIGIPKPKPN